MVLGWKYWEIKNLGKFFKNKEGSQKHGTHEFNSKIKLPNEKKKIKLHLFEKNKGQTAKKGFFY